MPEYLKLLPWSLDLLDNSFSFQWIEDHITNIWFQFCGVQPKIRDQIDKINLNFWKVKEVDTPKNSFIHEDKPFDVPCVWLILEKKEEKRKKEIKLKPTDFRFTTKQESNCTIRRVGVNAGFSSLNINVAEPSHYFIYVNNPLEFVNKMNTIVWEHNNTLGPRSISKNELIGEYNKLIS